MTLDEMKALLLNPGPVPGLPAWAKGCTATQRKQVVAGRHPMGPPLLGDPAKTCGNCAHLYRVSYTKVYIKCSLVPATGGPGTDVRVRWPACTKWAAESFTIWRGTGGRADGVLLFGRLGTEHPTLEGARTRRRCGRRFVPTNPEYSVMRCSLTRRHKGACCATDRDNHRFDWTPGGGI